MAYKDRNKKKTRKEIMQAFSLLGQIGTAMALAVLFSVMIGKWLDDWLNTTPLFIFIFSVIGIMAAFRNLFVITQKYWKK